MRNKMLRSVLVAAFSAVVALGALGGATGGKEDVRANSSWPVAPVDSGATGTTGEAGSVAEEAGS